MALYLCNQLFIMCSMVMKMNLLSFRLLAMAACVCFAVTSNGEYRIDYSAEVIANLGNGEFAPYYVMSNRHGILTSSKSTLVRGKLWRPVDTGRRFSYGFGADLIGGWGSSRDYLKFSEDKGTQYISRHPSYAWIQQLYGEVKYRGVFLTAGLRERSSAMLNQNLSSGDLVESGNARPIPEVRIGFMDFQNIPFTKGWLQIQGEISYGKYTDNKWMREHYNYMDYHINQGALNTYKRCYFRTMPSQPFSVTFGMQVGASFGGETKWYHKGKLDKEQKFSKGIRQFFKMLVPMDGGADYYSGSSLGSWDVMFRYRIRNGCTVKAYFQKPYEDGSGIGFLNGWDGVWGIEFATNCAAPVSGAVVEYLDFTNQSGPIHWDPDDYPGTGITGRAEGADDYYNNHEYNPYANYGMAIGSPFMVSPIYNTDGMMMFLYNRVRGFHIGIEGNIIDGVSYRVLGGYRRSWGNGYYPLMELKSDTSFMAEVKWDIAKVKGLVLKGQLAFDHGSLFGNNTGGCVSVSYSGNFQL